MFQECDNITIHIEVRRFVGYLKHWWNPYTNILQCRAIGWTTHLFWCPSSFGWFSCWATSTAARTSFTASILRKCVCDFQEPHIKTTVMLDHKEYYMGMCICRGMCMLMSMCMHIHERMHMRIRVCSCVTTRMFMCSCNVCRYVRECPCLCVCWMEAYPFTGGKLWIALSLQSERDEQDWSGLRSSEKQAFFRWFADISSANRAAMPMQNAYPAHMTRLILSFFLFFERGLHSPSVMFPRGALSDHRLIVAEDTPFHA
jgi:hypothetical protein